MLENERYGEAMEVLRFLLKCGGQNERHYEEWNSLLDWLEVAFPEQAVPRSVNEAEPEEDDPDEADMARQMVRDKVAQDAGYADKSLASVMNGPLTEQTILALEQLAYLDRPEIDAILVEWSHDTPLHPQFRVANARRRGMEGHVSLHRGQEAVEIEIDTVPWTREVSRMPLREFWSALPIRLRFMNRHCFILHRNYGLSSSWRFTAPKITIPCWMKKNPRLTYGRSLCMTSCRRV